MTGLLLVVYTRSYGVLFEHTLGDYYARFCLGISYSPDVPVDWNGLSLLCSGREDRFLLSYSSGTAS